MILIVIFETPLKQKVEVCLSGAISICFISVAVVVDKIKLLLNAVITILLLTRVCWPPKLTLIWLLSLLHRGQVESGIPNPVSLSNRRQI